jgi:hypothetical protein
MYPDKRDDEHPQKIWESSIILSLLILITSNLSLLGYFIWAFAGS